MIDYNLDGWSDLYFAQAGGDVRLSGSSGANELFRNLEGQRFVELAALAGADDTGFGQGVSVVDFNQDGFADLVVANIGVNVLLANQGDGTFAAQPLAPSIAGAEKWTTSVASGDLDGDHLPDLVEVNYIDDERAFDAVCHGDTGAPLCNPQRYRPAADRVLRNDGAGGWQSLAMGEADKIASYGFAALIANFDEQHGNDLFVANDTDANHYWVSSPKDEAGDGFVLKEQASLKGCALGPLGTAQSCMGVAHGDFDRNGLLDLHITNFTNESSDLYVQQASGLFQNQAVRYGLDLATGPMMGWGTQAVDFDSDGRLDLAILNGNLYNQSVDQTPYRMAPQLLRGMANRFEPVDAERAGDSFWQRPTLGRALTSLDWNRDGKVDLVANHLDVEAALLENRSESPGRWVQLELVGTVSEREAIGARVSVKTDAGDWTAWIVGGDAFLCNRERILHLGLGDSQAIESLEITWPSGRSQTFSDVGIERRHLAIEGQDTLFERH